MKYLLLTFSLFFINFIFGQFNSEDCIKKNRIKEIRVLDNQNKLANISKYDSLGRLVFSAMDDFTSATFLKTSITRIYDEKGNLIKTISTHSSFNEPTIWNYEYDQNNNKIAVKEENGNFVFQYFYDETNFLIKELSYDDDNKIRGITTFEKSKDGRKIVSKMGNEFINNRINTTYLDENENEIRHESIDGEEINFMSNSIFEDNKIIKETYNSDYGNNYYYNSKGKLIKREQFNIENGKEVPRNFEEFEYLENGLIEFYRENIYSGGKLRKYHFEYDYY